MMGVGRSITYTSLPERDTINPSVSSLQIGFAALRMRIFLTSSNSGLYSVSSLFLSLSLFLNLSHVPVLYVFPPTLSVLDVVVYKISYVHADHMPIPIPERKKEDEDEEKD